MLDSYYKLCDTADELAQYFKMGTVYRLCLSVQNSISKYVKLYGLALGSTFVVAYFAIFPYNFTYKEILPSKYAWFNTHNSAPVSSAAPVSHTDQVSTCLPLTGS